MIPSHLIQIAGKITRGDGIDLNPFPGQTITQVSAQMDHTCFAGSVGIIVSCIEFTTAVDRRDIDHIAWCFWRSPHAQEWQKCLGHKKDAFEIEIHHRVPGFLRHILDLPATIADSCVVDQDIERLFSFTVGFCQCPDSGD